MARDPQLLTRLARLAAEVAVDANAMKSRASEIEGLLVSWGNRPTLPRAELVLVAANLHGYYTAVETLLERVARQLDETVPAGPAWHVELLAQMQVEIPGLRPPVLDTAQVADLHELRKFRHFFRNAYVLELDPAHVRGHAERLVRVHGPVAASVARFAAHVERVLRELSKPG